MQAYDRLAQEEGGSDGDSEGENVDSEGESHESSAESGGESGIREECVEHKDGKKKSTKSKKKKGGKGGRRVDEQGTEEGEELMIRTASRKGLIRMARRVSVQRRMRLSAGKSRRTPLKPYLVKYRLAKGKHLYSIDLPNPVSNHA